MIAPTLFKLDELARFIFSDKELDILFSIDGRSASAISESCGMPRSTFWFNLRKLKAKGIVQFGDGPLRLTLLGDLIFPAVAQLEERSAVVGITSKASSPREAACANQARGTFGDVK